MVGNGHMQDTNGATSLRELAHCDLRSGTHTDLSSRSLALGFLCVNYHEASGSAHLTVATMRPSACLAEAHPRTHQKMPRKVAHRGFAVAEGPRDVAGWAEETHGYTDGYRAPLWPMAFQNPVLIVVPDCLDVALQAACSSSITRWSRERLTGTIAESDGAAPVVARRSRA
jgi:hypothetical protein